MQSISVKRRDIFELFSGCDFHLKRFYFQTPHNVSHASKSPFFVKHFFTLYYTLLTQQPFMAAPSLSHLTYNVIPRAIQANLPNFDSDEEQSLIRERCAELSRIQRVRNENLPVGAAIDLSQTYIYRRTRETVNVFLLVGIQTTSESTSYFIRPVYGLLHDAYMEGDLGWAIRNRRDEGKTNPHMVCRNVDWETMISYGREPTETTRLHKSGFVYMDGKFIHVGHFFDNVTARVPDWDIAKDRQECQLVLATSVRKATDTLRRKKRQLDMMVKEIAAVQSALMLSGEKDTDGEHTDKRSRVTMSDDETTKT